MHPWQRFLLGSALLAAVAVAGIALNFTLLGLTQDENDPVGKLSPRAVFLGKPARPTPTTPVATTLTTPVTTTGTTTGRDDDSSHGGDGSTRPRDEDDDDD